MSDSQPENEVNKQAAVASGDPKSQVQETVVSIITSPQPTPSFGNNGLFAVKASVIIHASVDSIYNATIDTANFNKWNTFVPSVQIIKSKPPTNNHEASTLQVGTEMVFQVCMKGKGTSTRPSTEIVTTLEDLTDGRKGRRVAWKSAGFPGLKGERVHEIVEIEAGDPNVPLSAKTEYLTWETLGGPLAYVLRFMVKDDLRDRFEDWTRDLKGYCEGLEGSA